MQNDDDIQEERRSLNKCHYTVQTSGLVVSGINLKKHDNAMLPPFEISSSSDPKLKESPDMTPLSPLATPSLKIPQIDGTSTGMHRLPCVIIESTWYEVSIT